VKEGHDTVYVPLSTSDTLLPVGLHFALKVESATEYTTDTVLSDAYTTGVLRIAKT